jgi:hypothetical protein
MAARRTEELLRAALRVPDRIPYARKRSVRSELAASGEERAAEVRELHARAVSLDGWPDALAREPCVPVDHAAVFGLAGLAPAVGQVGELVAGGTVDGELVAAAGPDLHLLVPDGDVVVLDTRLMTGWELVTSGRESAPGGTGTAFPVRRFADAGTGAAGGGVQDGLF